MLHFWVPHVRTRLSLVGSFKRATSLKLTSLAIKASFASLAIEAPFGRFDRSTWRKSTDAHTSNFSKTFSNFHYSLIHL